MSIEKALEDIGYTQQWLTHGIISESYLLTQFEDLKQTGYYRPDDPHTEHYRYEGFSHYLKNKNALSDQDITAIFALRDNGPDGYELVDDRIISLIESNLLTFEQLIKLADFPQIHERPINKRYQRKLLISQVEQSSVAQYFEAIKQSTDPAIFEFVLTRADLTTEHVSWLATNGINKKTRNIAKQMLNSKRFRNKQ